MKNLVGPVYTLTQFYGISEDHVGFSGRISSENGTPELAYRKTASLFLSVTPTQTHPNFPVMAIQVVEFSREKYKIN